MVGHTARNRTRGILQGRVRKILQTASTVRRVTSTRANTGSRTAATFKAQEACRHESRSAPKAWQTPKQKAGPPERMNWSPKVGLAK
jgi:hypothetical protein